MGRSVSYLSYAEYVLFFTADWIGKDEDDNFNEDQSYFDWEDFKNNLVSNITSKLKSYNECEKWDCNEVSIFLENELCEIALSEYCGLYSLSIRAKDDEFYNSYENVKEGLAKHHTHQIRKTLSVALEKSGATLLQKVGTFSNGESVYELAK